MKKVLISLFVLISLLLTGCQETSISNSISNSNESSEVVDSSTNDESSTTSESVNSEVVPSHNELKKEYNYEGVIEIEMNNIVSFEINQYTIDMDGLPIQLTLDGANLLYMTDELSFSKNRNVKEISAVSGDEIRCWPNYTYGGVFGSNYKVTDDSYVDILIYKNGTIVGYSVIKILYEDNTYSPKLLTCNVFMKDSKYASVDYNYVMELISKYHENEKSKDESINVSYNYDYLFEKEMNESIYFRIGHFSNGLSSISGQPIQTTLEDATFIYMTDKGSFAYYSDVKKIPALSNEEVYYSPMYQSRGLNEQYNVKEDSYVDILICKAGGIIGYAVIKINYHTNNNSYTPEILVCNVFMNGSNYASVDYDYALSLIENHHK